MPFGYYEQRGLNIIMPAFLLDYQTNSAAQINIDFDNFGCYHNSMKIEFDAAKNQRNIRERELNFSDVYAFDFDTAIATQDTRLA